MHDYRVINYHVIKTSLTLYLKDKRRFKYYGYSYIELTKWDIFKFCNLKNAYNVILWPFTPFTNLMHINEFILLQFSFYLKNYE